MATVQTTEASEGAEKQQVDGAEWLLRAIPPSQYAATDAAGKPSSAPFKEDLFSVDIESLTTHDTIFSRWPRGTVLFRFRCKTARELGYSVFPEPEHGNDAHANVRHVGNPGRSKARKLAETVEVIFPTDSSPCSDDAKTKG